MKTPADKSPDNQRQATTNDVSQLQASTETEYEFIDNRAETVNLRQLQEAADNSPRAQDLSQLKVMMNSSPRNAAMQNLQATTIDNSPRQLIQGKVKPTAQMKDIKDGYDLEKNTDVMGTRATQLQNDGTSSIASSKSIKNGSKYNPYVSQENSKGIVQRAVQVEGVAQTVAQVTAHFHGTPNALTAPQIQILQSWSDSGTLHNFRPSQGRTGWDKVPLALGRANAMPNNAPPALFTAANLRFITQSGNRLATYYFSTGGQTGRLRQQHKSGPLAEIDPQVNTRISFANRGDRTAFVNALRASRTNGAAFVDPDPTLWGQPAVGQHLLEYHLTGGVAVGWHPSGGLIQNVPLAQNNDVAIAAIYNNIIGADDIADQGSGLFGCCFITTACIISKGLPDDCEELEVLRDFRDNYLINREHGRELFNFYYTHSPSIVSGINSQPDAPEIYESLYTVIQNCVGYIRRDELEKAFRIYVQMVLMLREKYTPKTEIPDNLNMILQSTLKSSDSQ